MFAAIYQYLTSAGPAFNRLELHLTENPSLLERQLNEDNNRANEQFSTYIGEIKLAAMKQISPDEQPKSFLERLSASYCSKIIPFEAWTKGEFATSGKVIKFIRENYDQVAPLVKNEGFYVAAEFIDRFAFFEVD